MKVCVVGAGAVGGLVAGWLGHRVGAAGVQLSVLARGATLAALQRDGLRIEQASGPVVVQPILASDQPDALGLPDPGVVSGKGAAPGPRAPAVGGAGTADGAPDIAEGGSGGPPSAVTASASARAASRAFPTPAWPYWLATCRGV